MIQLAPDFGVKLRARDELARDSLFVEDHGRYVANRHWLSSAVPPSVIPASVSTPPPSSLTLDWVYGRHQDTPATCYSSY
jgi:hypothetical protein